MSIPILSIALALVGFAAGIVAAVLFVTTTSEDREEAGTVDSASRAPDRSDRSRSSPDERSDSSGESGHSTDRFETVAKDAESPVREEPSSDIEIDDGFGKNSEGIAPPSDDQTEKISKDEIQSLVVSDSEVEQAYLVVVSGNRVGEMIGVENDLILGRNPELADVSFHDKTVSSRHARLRRDGERTVIEDLDSANGTYINAEQVSQGELNDGDKITLGRTTVLKFTFQDELDEEFQQQMYESSTRDQLTGALTKTHFLDRMKSELSYARRHDTNLCVIIFDLDHFKHINDTYGHVAGDQILRKIGDLVRSVTRDETMFARYGGEEFIAAERNTDVEVGARIAERIRQTVGNYTFEAAGEHIQVTLSFGVADRHCVDSFTRAELIKCADEALYEAKEAGRNQVVAAPEMTRN